MTRDEWNNLEVGDVLMGDSSSPSLNRSYHGKLVTVVDIIDRSGDVNYLALKLSWTNGIVNSLSHFYYLLHKKMDKSAVDWRMV